MPTVNSSLIVSLVKKFYDVVNGTGGIFQIGLNISPSSLLSGTSCSSTSSPGCVNATYNGSLSAGSMTASFSATFSPSAGYSLTELSLVTLNTRYKLGLIDMTGFSASLNAGTSYTVVLQDQITYPTTI